MECHRGNGENKGRGGYCECHEILAAGDTQAATDVVRCLQTACLKQTGGTRPESGAKQPLRNHIDWSLDVCSWMRTPTVKWLGSAVLHRPSPLKNNINRMSFIFEKIAVWSKITKIGLRHNYWWSTSWAHKLVISQCSLIIQLQTRTIKVTILNKMFLEYFSYASSH